MEFQIISTGQLIDDTLLVLLKNVPIETDVTVYASTLDADGRIWQSWAKFRADQAGVIDTSKQAPIDGTYAGIDSTGLIWSMCPKTCSENHPKFTAGEFVSLTVKFRAFINGAIVASAEVERIIKSVDVICDLVKDNDMYGWFYRPDLTVNRIQSTDIKKLPAVLLVPGIGGCRSLMPVAALLASRGYAVLLLIYRGYAELSSDSYAVPLERISTAVEWLVRHSIVDTQRIAGIGSCIGSEILLAAAAYLPNIQLQTLILHDPSNVIWQPSLSYQGKELPFVPVKTKKLLWQRLKYKCMRLFGVSKFFTQLQGIELVSIYLAALDNKLAVDQALIPVKNLRQSILLISGKSDAIAPCEMMGDQLLQKIKATNPHCECAHHSYDGLGHGLSIPGIPTTGLVLSCGGNDMQLACGGTPQTTAHASCVMWQKTLDFLHKHLVDINH